MTHLVLIPWTGIGLYGGFRGDEWYAKRIEIFKNYTLKSLANQTNKEFIIWCTFRPQEKNNPLTGEIRRAILDAGLRCVFTFHGPVFWDDKFGGSFKDKIKNAGRVFRGCYRNKTWRDLIPNLKEILWSDKNATLEERLGKSLANLQAALVGWELTDDVLLTRIDSDDMFDRNVVSLVQQGQASVTKPRAIRLKLGYIHNISTGHVAEYNPPTNPPFYTLCFTTEQFLDPRRHLEAYEGFNSHEDIARIEPSLTFNNLRLYCVTVRDDPKTHISTNWDHPFRGAIVDPSVLKDFGL